MAGAGSWDISKKKRILSGLSIELVAVFLVVLIVTTIAQMLYFSNIMIKKIQDDAQKSVSEILKLNKENMDDRILQVFEQFVSLKLTIESILNVNNYKEADSFWQTDYITLLKTQMEAIYISNNSNLIATTAYLKDLDYVLNCGLPLDGYYRRQLETLEESAWEENSYLWINPNDGTENENEQVPLAIVAPLRGTAGQNYGYLLFRFRTELFMEILREFTFFEHGYMVIITGERGSLVANQPLLSLNRETVQYLLESPQSTGVVQNAAAPHNITVLYETLVCNQWKLAAVYSNDEALSAATVYRLFPVFTLAISFVGILVIFAIVRIRVTEPALALADKVRRIAYPSEKPTGLRHMSKELLFVDTALDAMVLRIEELIQDIQGKEEQKRRLESHLLQEQIHPHFLYNSLFAIDQLVQMGEIEDAHKMLCALSQFYRISLSKGDALLPLYEEIKLTEEFLCIQQMRFGDRFTYRIETTGALESIRIPKMTLQPIVENAIVHGLSDDFSSDKKGELLIRCSGLTNFVHIEVHDNGLGMNEARLAEVRAALCEDFSDGNVSSCFALRNVSSRLKLYYHGQCSLQVLSQLHVGTTFIIDISLPPEGLHV